MKLALYRGPATGILNTLGHWLICIGTWSRYSHVELQCNGVCWSSSYRDGGVRGKVIDLTSGKWDVLDIGGDDQKALDWFQAHTGCHYDWSGVLGFIFPSFKQRPGEYFCSEAVSSALIQAGLILPTIDPSGITPQNLDDYFLQSGI